MDEISYQKFLTTRICDLELDVNESMAPFFKRLKKELRETSNPPCGRISILGMSGVV